MLGRAPALLAVTLLTALHSAGALDGARPAFTPADINKLESAEQSLGVCEEQLSRVLGEVLSMPKPGLGRDAAVVNKLEAIAQKVEVVERRVEDVLGPVLERHVEDPGPLTGLSNALDGLAARSESLVGLLGEFLEMVPRDRVRAEAFVVAESLLDQLQASIVALGLDFYRAVIPIRFVEFIEPGAPSVTGDRLEYNVAIANQIFLPARLRFYVKKNLVIAGTEFVDLFLRGSNGQPLLDEDGKPIQGVYSWPEEWWMSPLVWPLHWGDSVTCNLVLPPPNSTSGARTESRSSAQERAGTYCCREGEIIVYINQGSSNGGQYPWYARIIGMTAGHMATKGSWYNKFVFAHELGHYFGLPHTFPSVQHYNRDYDLARIVTNPTEEQPLETIRRWFEPHENLVNVETGQMAPLSLFWDMVFRPGWVSGGPPQHLFFNSRAEAALYEGLLQPISEWRNAYYFRPGQISCNEGSASTRVQHIVAAGCRGTSGYFGDCVHPFERYCTGDPEVRAFSRLAWNPDRIRVNVMNYGYLMADGTNVPSDLIESNFLSASQLEQIDRVMKPEYDVATRYFPEMTGMRPQLRSCEGCHSGRAALSGRVGSTPSKPGATGPMPGATMVGGGR